MADVREEWNVDGRSFGQLSQLGRLGNFGIFGGLAFVRRTRQIQLPSTFIRTEYAVRSIHHT